MGIRSFAFSLFALLLKIAHIKEVAVHSRLSLKMSDRERIALDKKAIVSKSLSYLLVIQTKITLKNERFARKNSYFLTVFQCCPPFLCPRGNRFHCSFTLFCIRRAAGAICSFSQVMRSFSRANRSFAFSL